MKRLAVLKGVNAANSVGELDEFICGLSGFLDWLGGIIEAQGHNGTLFAGHRYGFSATGFRRTVLRLSGCQSSLTGFTAIVTLPGDRNSSVPIFPSLNLPPAAMTVFFAS